MRHIVSFPRLFGSLFICAALVGCDKVPLVRNAGDAVPASPGVNRAPIVDAGADATLHWPESSVELQATAVDDGLPADGKLRLTWFSSSSDAQIEQPMSVKTLVRFPAPGIYTMTLAADDGALRHAPMIRNEKRYDEAR